MAGRTREANTAYRRAFGQRLRQLRDERGFSQEGLALESGIARSYLGGIERGEKNPALDHIVRLSTTLDVQPSELMPDRP
jgi:transcriptional regulator with XRE-family HTH domain